MKSRKALIFFTRTPIPAILICMHLLWSLPTSFAGEAPWTPDKTVQAEVRIITETHEAVGTVRPQTETKIEARVTAQVVDVEVRPGNKVSKGEVLVRLDDRQFQSRLDQAKQALKTAEAGKQQAQQTINAAQAAFTQARSEKDRVEGYFKSQAATEQQLEKANADFLQARAGLSRAKEALNAAESRILQAEEVIREAEISLGYTLIEAPAGGEVLKRTVEPGDLALPGKPLLVLQTTGYLRLEAYVREGLIRKVIPGAKLKVDITTLDQVVEAVVEEIVPYADPETRTFLVKVNLPKITGLYPGMFGKLLIPVRDIEVVVVPAEAVRRVGQLEMVYAKVGERFESRYIKAGKMIGDGRVEVLSGLSGNETLGIKEWK